MDPSPQPNAMEALDTAGVSIPLDLSSWELDDVLERNVSAVTWSQSAFNLPTTHEPHICWELSHLPAKLTEVTLLTNVIRALDTVGAHLPMVMKSLELDMEPRRLEWTASDCPSA